MRTIVVFKRLLYYMYGVTAKIGIKIDITPQQLEKGQAAIKTSGLTDITFNCADILDLDLGDQEGDAEYDYIISHDMLIQSFLKELNADAETFHSLAGIREQGGRQR